MEVLAKKRKISNEELRVSKRCQFDSDVSVSCCSSYGSVNEIFKCRDLEVSENERDHDSDARERESTPTSKSTDEIVEKKPKSPEKIKPRLEIPPEKTPPADEIEAFFAAAENDLHKRFKEKYNFDIVNDVPLKGRYEWVELKP